MAMDCNSAQRILDVTVQHLRRDRETQSALAHMRQCADCRSVWQARQRFDDDLLVALDDVEIPVGLEARLLAAVKAVARPNAPQAVPPAPLATGRPRVRGWMAAAATLFLAVAAWQAVAWQMRPRQVALEDLRVRAAELLEQVSRGDDLSALPAFDGAFRVDGLSGWLQSVDARGLDLDGRKGHDGLAAMVQLSQSPGSKAIVLIVPASRVAGASRLAAGDAVRYAPAPHVAVRSGDYVYICCTTPAHLPVLERWAAGAAA
ncbi:MAG: hypothetical protein KF774_09460 [Planctomyces sp.]|nr:hypothetical protein [Planctomyces sp.]